MAKQSKTGKQAQPKTYIANLTINELNAHFYDRYEPNFLFNKALTLHTITREREKFVHALASFDSYEELKPYITDQYFEALRAELHFMETHQLEAFFALVLAAFQDKPHWLFLTEYTNAKIKTSVDHLLAGDIAALTSGMVTNERDFVTWAVYEGHRPDASEWDTNLDNHWWILQRMAKRYRDAADGAEYNAYKHGLRVMMGPSFWSLGDPDAPLISNESPDSVTYLDMKRTDEGYLELRQVTKQFDPEESFFYLDFIHHMLNTMTKLRRARYLGGVQNVVGHTILDLDKNDVAALSLKNASLSAAL